MCPIPHVDRRDDHEHESSEEDTDRNKKPHPINDALGQAMADLQREKEEMEAKALQEEEQDKSGVDKMNTPDIE